MAWIEQRRRVDGGLTARVIWRLGGGRDAVRASETFSIGSAAQNLARADGFKRMVEAGGERWPDGWVKGEGFVRPLDVADPLTRPPRFDEIGEEYVRQIVDLSPGQRKRYLGQLQVLAGTPVRGSLVFAGQVTAIGEAQLGGLAEQGAQQALSVLHGAGEDVVAADQGGADQCLRACGWGLAGDESGQPFPADGPSGPPGRVVGDHPSPLNPLRLPGSLIVVHVVGSARPADRLTVRVAVSQARRVGIGADPHRNEHRCRVVIASGEVLVLAVLGGLVVGVAPFRRHDHGSPGNARPFRLGDGLAVAADQSVQPQRSPVGGKVGRVERRESFGAESLRLGGQSGGVGGGVAQLLRDVGEWPVPRQRSGELLGGLVVAFDYVDNSGLSSRLTGRTEPFPTVEVWPVAVRVHRTMVCARNAADPHGRSAHAICARWVRTRTVEVQRFRFRRFPGRSARVGRSPQCMPILRMARWRRGRRVRTRMLAGCRAPWPLRS